MIDESTPHGLSLNRDPEVLRTLVEGALVGIYLIQDGRFHYCNPQMADIFGYERPEDIVGLTVPELVWPEDRDLVIGNVQRRIDGGVKSIQYDFRGLRRDGEPVPVEVRGTATVYRGRPAVIGTIVDITQRRRQEQRIRRLAYFDPLSRLPNRRFLTRQTRHDLALAKRQGQPLSLLYVDLNRFKVINDNWGHRFGDGILKGVAHRFQTVIRESDTLARLGGDEFVLLLPDTDEADAVQVAEKLGDSLDAAICVGGMDLRVSVSIGVATHPEHGDSFSELLKHADIAMYKAKHRGEPVCRYRRSDSQALEQQVSFERELERALDEGELFLHFQPRISLRTGQVDSVEALARWSRHGQELVGPAQFIAMAEESGLIHRLGEWVLEEACTQVLRWSSEGLALRVAINLSGRELDRGHIVARFRSALDRYGVDSGQLEVEITESAAVRDIEKQFEQLTALRRLGIRIAVDDFGTGYSSLRYLHRLPLDIVKIDRCFISDLDEREGASRMIETIVALARSLGCTTVAEGVETETQAQALRGFGCDQVQGFHYCPPVSASELSALWRLGTLGMAGGAGPIARST